MAFSDLVANQTQRVGVVIRIDGVGINSVTSAQLTALNSDARVRFCSSVPAYADSTVLDWYKPILVDFPDEIGRRGDPFGGIPKDASLSLTLLDHEDWLTSNLRIEAPSVDNLASAVSTTTGTSITVQDDTNFAVNDVIWVSQEAMRVTALPGSDVLTVTRGFLGTDAATHKKNSEIFSYVNFLRGRFVEMSLFDLDASAESEEVGVGTWLIDGLGWDPSMNTFRFECSSRLRSVGRMVPRYNRATLTVTAPINSAGIVYVERDGSIPHHHGNYGFLKIEDEVLEWYKSSGAITSNFKPTRRNLAGTKFRELEPGDRGVRVFVADTSLAAPSFRWSDPTEGTVATSRASGNWTNSAHFIDIILNIMTSGADSDNIANTAFYSSSKGNWAQLPRGMGASIPFADLDIDGWLDVKVRTQPFVFPNFVYGDKPRELGELIEEEFLKPIGAYFGIDRSTGKITIVLPRMPLAGDSVLTLGTEDILMREVGQNSFEPSMAVDYPLENLIGGVGFKVGPDGQQIRLRINDEIAQMNEYFRGEAEPEIISVPGADRSQQNFLIIIAMSRLFRSSRPQLRARLETSLKTYAANVGDIWTVTYPQVPNLADGTRGRDDVLSGVLETSIRFDEKMGAYVDASVIGYVNSVNIGAVAPCGDITAVADSDNFTIAANVFTCPNATGGLPTTDAAAFEVGDTLYMYDSRGAYAGGGLATIAGISGNDIELETGHGWTLSTANFIRLANFANATADMKADHAFMGDKATHSVLTGGELYVWGEP